jgi:hypothetical protein
MSLEVVYQGGERTTVPYGPIFDGIRKIIEGLSMLTGGRT